MAQLIINVPDNLVSRAFAAFKPDVATEENPDPTNAEIKAHVQNAFAKAIVDKVHRHEQDEARKAAADAIAPIDLGAQG